MSIYYVYFYLRSKDSKTAKAGTPYYIGKGKNNRINEDHKWHKPPKNKSNKIKIHENLTEIQAFILERYYIRWFGRKNNGTGILINKTDGGEGATGAKRVITKNSIEKMLATRAQNNSYVTGIRKTMETRKKLGNLGSGKEGGKKSWETRIKNGNTKRSKESIDKGIHTKRLKGISITNHLQTPENRIKSKETCNNLLKRDNVSLLRELSKKYKIKLGSGWSRKPDPWIENKIQEISTIKNHISVS